MSRSKQIEYFETFSVQLRGQAPDFVKVQPKLAISESRFEHERYYDCARSLGYTVLQGDGKIVEYIEPLETSSWPASEGIDGIVYHKGKLGALLGAEVRVNYLRDFLPDTAVFARNQSGRLVPESDLLNARAIAEELEIKVPDFSDVSFFTHIAENRPSPR
jgi:hypothetical protein